MSKGWFRLILSLQVVALLIGVLVLLAWFGVQVKSVMYHFTTNAMETTDMLINQGDLILGPGVEPVDIAFKYSFAAREAYYAVSGVPILFVFSLVLVAINSILMVAARLRTKAHRVERGA